MPNTPVTKADLAELNTSIAALTAAFEATDQFAHETRNATDQANRANRNVLVVAMALVVLVAFGFYLQDRSEDNRRLIELRQDYDVSACERGNATRAAQRQQWLDARNLLTALGSGQETRRFANGLVANANKNFPDLDCSLIREGKNPMPPATPDPATPPE